MNFLITGDSWSVGEHQDTQSQPKLNTNGLTECLAKDGHSVINIGKSGFSNSAISWHLATFLDTNRHLQFDKILVFQTEFTRCIEKLDQLDCDLSSLQSKWISQFYQNLSNTATKNHCQIYIIGGCGDALWLNDLEYEYPNVSIACQSFTNLLVNNDHKVDTPVFDMYNHAQLPLVENIKKYCNFDQLEFLIESIDQAIIRRKVWHDHPEWFFPDGVHPNQKAFERLYKFLIDQSVI